MKSGFTTSLSVKLKDGEDHVWMVTAPLYYCSERLDRMIVVPPWFEVQGGEVPNGEPEYFYTDLASVPRIPIFYTLWGDRAHREAVLHDYLYRVDSVPTVSKYDADCTFLEAMKSTGKPWYITYPMFIGVQVGGSSSYHRKKVKDRL